MNKCQALNGWQRCWQDGRWTLAAGSIQAVTCGVHLTDAFLFLLLAHDNAVERPINISVYYTSESLPKWTKQSNL